jgi:hypothetical protein
MDEVLEHDRKHTARQGPKQHRIACDPLAVVQRMLWGMGSAMAVAVVRRSLALSSSIQTTAMQSY